VGRQHKLSVQERLEATEAACLAAQHRITTSWRAAPAVCPGRSPEGNHVWDY
jgi:hypothetical protein